MTLHLSILLKDLYRVPVHPYKVLECLKYISGKFKALKSLKNGASSATGLKMS